MASAQIVRFSGSFSSLCLTATTRSTIDTTIVYSTHVFGAMPLPVLDLVRLASVC